MSTFRRTREAYREIERALIPGTSLVSPDGQDRMTEILTDLYRTDGFRAVAAVARCVERRLYDRPTKPLHLELDRG